MGRRLIISATGFPGTNKTLRAVQDGTTELINAIGRLCGNNTIISGVEIDGDNVTAGFIVINNEVVPFEAGPFHETVSLMEEVENDAYNTDIDNPEEINLLPAYKLVYATCGPGGAVTVPFADLVRLDSVKELSQFSLPAGIVIDPAYVHTDNNFTTLLLEKLIGIEAEAQKNVQADWNVTNPSSDAFIKNKPNGVFSHVRYAELAPGDLNGTAVYDLVINPTPMPDANYMVLYIIESTANNATIAHRTASIIGVVYDKTPSQFKFAVRELEGINQQPRYRFLIIKHPDLTLP